MKQVPAFLGPLIAIETVELDNWSLELDATAPGNVLAMEVQSQLLSNWCWAATTASIEAWYHEPYAQEQCAVASEWLGLACCPPGPDPCNREYNLPTSLRRNAAAPPIGGPILPQQIVQAINASQPICCAIRWKSTGKFHFAVLVGYYSNGNLVLRDPLYGEHVMPYDQFKSHYGPDGEWAGTLLTRKHA